MNRLGLAVLLVLVGVPAQAERLPDGGGEAPLVPSQSCLTEEQRQLIKAQIHRNLAELGSRRQLPFDVTQVGLAWPIKGATPLGDPGVHGISNFVDQNSLFPNQLADYFCGTPPRTYDNSGGYNHAGTDIFIWPFSWLKMDRSHVQVVAAAPGTIAFKSDGNFDRSCATAKPVGQTVAAGEYLGIVGSSGNSTGPHLHFELYDANDNLIDPYQGACNTLNPTSWWTAQRPYRDSAINKLATHTAPPVFPACPTQETPNLSNYLTPGVTYPFAAYYRDHVAGQQTVYTIQRPDGSTWQTWIGSAPVTYDGSYWYWNWALPMSPLGRWNFRAVYQGVTTNHGFNLLAAGDLIFLDGFQLGL
jgi:hypothetical protein